MQGTIGGCGLGSGKDTSLIVVTGWASSEY